MQYALRYKILLLGPKCSSPAQVANPAELAELLFARQIATIDDPTNESHRLKESKATLAKSLCEARGTAIHKCSQ